MSDQQSSYGIPDEGPAPKRGSGQLWYIVNVKTGKFDFQTGKNQPYQQADFVRGYLRAHYLEWDEGHPDANPKKHVPARWVVSVVVETKSGTVLIKGLGTAVSFISLASQLRSAQKDQVVSIVPRKANEDSSVFFDVHLWDGSAWLEADDQDIWDTEKNPKESRLDVCIGWLRNHPALVAPPADSESPSSSSSQQTAAGTPAGQSTAPAQAASPASDWPKAPDGTVIWGFAPPRWYKPGMESQEPAEAQMNALNAKALERGLTLIELRMIGDAYLAVAGQPAMPFGKWTKAGFVLVYDFISSAPNDILAKAKGIAMPSTLKVDGDPFENE